MGLSASKENFMKRLLIAITLACVLASTALAGEMPGVTSGSVSTDVPTVGSTTTTTTPPPPPGEMPGVNPKDAITAQPSITTYVLLAVITLLGR
jgi:hypothetical protein